MSISTDRSDTLRILESDYGITGGQIYLLPVLPLIEMVWVDGRNQPAELELVAEYIERHLSDLNEEAGGINVVSREELEQFMNRFVRVRPESELLTAVRNLTFPALLGNTCAKRERKSRQILDYCLDIASACVRDYPYGQRERFLREEKSLLHELAEALRVSCDKECSL